MPVPHATLVLVLSQNDLLRGQIARELALTWGVVTASTIDEAKRVLARKRVSIGAILADVAVDPQLESLRYVQTWDDPVARLLLVGASPWRQWTAAPAVADACLPMPWQPGGLVTLVGETITAILLVRGTAPPPDRH